MRRAMRDLGYGTILAAVAAGISCLLALAGYQRSYYLAVFLPAFMLGYLLVAWFLYLRKDRLMGSPSAMRGRPRKHEPSRASAHGRTSGVPEELLCAAASRDEDATPVDSARSGAGESDRQPRLTRALVWAAVELGIAASLLYSAGGIGAAYHR
jgi:hypothetical protein